MAPELSEEKRLDEVLKELGVEDEEDRAMPRLPEKVEDRSYLRLPANMEFFRRDSEIEIVQKWFGWKIVLAIKRLLPDFKGAEAGKPVPAWLAAVLAGAYRALEGYLYRAHIVVSHAKIAVRYGPMAGGGYDEFEVSNLRQLYAREQIHGGRSGTYVTYDVYAVRADERKIILVSGLSSREQASYVEQQVEKYLGIRNVPVADEIRAALGKEVALDASVPVAYAPSVERAHSDRGIRDVLLASALVRQEKRQVLRDQQDVMDLALNWQERGRPDRLRHADLSQADLRGANLGKDEEGHPGANLSFANLCQATLDGVDLREADLYNANLSRATLKGTNLEGANLYEANLNGANLEGARLVDAKVMSEHLAQAKSLKGTVMPDGTVHP